MGKASEYLRRSLLPRAVIAASEIDWPHRLKLRLRRSLGGSPCIELYFAFDDPYSAIALPPLLEMTARRGVELKLYPLIERGIPDDPAGVQRRLHAVADSGWLARRASRTLLRQEPIDPQHTAFLAAWTESARGSAGMAPFAAAALEQLWFRWTGEVRQHDFMPLYRIYLHQDSPPELKAMLPRLLENTQRLNRKGHWESPAALVEGQWFFAHERIPQIESRLAGLGA